MEKWRDVERESERVRQRDGEKERERQRDEEMERWTERERERVRQRDGEKEREEDVGKKLYLEPPSLPFDTNASSVLENTIRKEKPRHDTRETNKS